MIGCSLLVCIVPMYVFVFWAGGLYYVMHQSFVTPAPSRPRNSGAFNFSIFKALLKALHCRAKFVVKSPLKAPAPGGWQYQNKERQLNRII